jgi:hypothetical protein
MYVLAEEKFKSIEKRMKTNPRKYFSRLCVQSRVSKPSAHRATNLQNLRSYKIRAVELNTPSKLGNKKPVMHVVSRVDNMGIYCCGTCVLFSWMRHGLYYAGM